MRSFLVFSLLSFILSSFSIEHRMPVDNPEETALSVNDLMFLGVNFEKLKLLGEEGFVGKSGNTKCEALGYKYFDTWNEVFILENKKFSIERYFQVDDHEVSLDWTMSLNKASSTEDCIIQKRPYKLSEEDIASVISGYVRKVPSGTGVVLIGESLSKRDMMGCYYVVYFDTSTGNILLSKKYEAAPVGTGFDNFWVNTIHKTLEQHYQYVKSTRKDLGIKL